MLSTRIMFPLVLLTLVLGVGCSRTQREQNGKGNSEGTITSRSTIEPTPQVQKQDTHHDNVSKELVDVPLPSLEGIERIEIRWNDFRDRQDGPPMAFDVPLRQYKTFSTILGRGVPYPNDVLRVAVGCVSLSFSDGRTDKLRLMYMEEVEGGGVGLLFGGRPERNIYLVGDVTEMEERILALWREVNREESQD